MRSLIVGGGLAVGTALVGCAGLEAKKVPLEERHACRDQHHHGFRYYLSRPYLVVSQRVDVVTTYEAARIGYVAKNEKPVTEPCGQVKTVLEGIDTEGCRRLYDMSGRLLPADMQNLTLLPFERPNKATPNTTTGGTGQATTATGTAPPATGTPAAPGFPPVPAPMGAATSPPAVSGEEPNTGGGGNNGGSVDGEDTLSIIFLPDFEEQMTVRSKNVLAHTKFSLQFQDGWQLKSVAGNHDSTVVPVQILNTIRNAISAAGGVEERRLQLTGQPPVKPPSAEDQENKARNKAAVPTVTTRIVRTTYIEPGMYRLRKASEQAAATQSGLGILSDLGIPVLEEVRVEVIKGQ